MLHVGLDTPYLSSFYKGHRKSEPSRDFDILNTHMRYENRNEHVPV